MWRICFGNKEGWAHSIANTVDRGRFVCSFSDLHLMDVTNFDCVVPLTLEDYDALQDHIQFFGKKFWSPPPNTVDICDDKLALNRLLLKGEFAELVPPLRECKTGQFPYILKKRHDSFGENSAVVWNSEDELAMASMLQSPEYFCQTYIPGKVEYALHVLLVDGKVAYAKTVKYEFGRDFYVKGVNFNSGRRTILPDGRTTYLLDNEHIAIFSRMLTTLGYTGTCCINYKMHDGLPMLLEINPRFGASLIGDINCYLEAYLGSLGLMDETEFQHGKIPHTLKSMRQIAMSIRSHAPYKVWRVMSGTRNACNRFYRGIHKATRLLTALGRKAHPANAGQ